MPIISMSVVGLRNLKSTTLSLSSKINLFYGPNGSGKTSILEAIYLLGLARSFRSHKINTVINSELNECTIFAQIKKSDYFIHQLGVNRNKQGELKIRIDGQNIRTVIELADILPLQIINPDSFRLLEGSPKLRRQFLDWGVFHTEPQFLIAWQRVQKCLKHRNSLLRKFSKYSIELEAWDHEFCLASEEIDRYRNHYMELLKPIFKEILLELLSLKDFTLNYYRGWDKDKYLQDICNNNFERDLLLGYTQSGPQRADLRFRLNNNNAVDILSRGQQKLVVCALKIAQGYLINKDKKGQVIYLVDDLASELDEYHRMVLCKLLEELNCQVFITGVEKEPLYSLFQKNDELTIFNVNHGEILTIEI